jgi:hypothetical protein
MRAGDIRALPSLTAEARTLGRQLADLLRRSESLAIEIARAERNAGRDAWADQTIATIRRELTESFHQEGLGNEGRVLFRRLLGP